jgi:histidine kinase/DNA gyrase B/HSP90-like ATPase/GAF domain-containing protein
LILDSMNAIARGIAAEPDIGRGLQQFLKGIVEAVPADRGRIYNLDLGKSKYLLQIEYDRATDEFNLSPPADLGVDIDSLLEKQDNALRSPLEEAIISQKAAYASRDVTGEFSSLSESMKSGFFVPLLRGMSCLGVLILESERANFPGVFDFRHIELARTFLLILTERQASLALLKAVQEPIDFTKPLDEFLDALLVLIADASKMPFIEIHELDEDRQALRCIALYGFDDNTDKAAFDLAPLRAFQPFASAVDEGRTIVQRSMAQSHLSTMRQRPELDRLRSIVVAPIRVGTTTFGTLSFGAMCPFDYWPIEIAGFESIANSIGVAIAHSRNAHRLTGISIADARLGIAIAGVEVAQSARHEVRGAVDDCQSSLVTIKNYSKSPRENHLRIEDEIARLGDRLFTIHTAMDKIRDATREPHDDIQSVSIHSVWDQAIALVSAKLAEERIRSHITGKDIAIDVFPDSLRHAFLHLLLNSIDAFKERRAKSDRQIMISIDPRSPDALNIGIRYTDNATGIEPTAFKQPNEGEPRDIKDLIFEKGITTKISGSGFGLYLTRLILDRHHGSIALVNYRGGVVFDLILPKDLKSRISKREGKMLT